MRKWSLVFGFALLLSCQIPACGQDDEKNRRLFQDAIQILGGDPYLKVADSVSEGNYFMFDREGASSGLLKFNDWTKLPDKSRFELGNRKKERDVFVFNLEKKEGWILEGQKDTRTATQEELKEFQTSVKHSIEYIFRYRYKDPENKLFYLGLADDNSQLEMVKMIDSENDEITVYFDRLSKLPARVEYQVVDQRGVRYRQVEEFSQWHMIQGVNTPMRIDVTRNGRPYSQQFITKITYNNALTDSFFVKPIPPK
jgi:hypothetical protein